jgi:hypothetical protein
VSLRLTRMRVDRFGPLRGLDLVLGPLTVIVGRNEVGKSSIVDALHAWLRRSFRRANAVSWDGVRRNLPGYDGTVEVELTSALGATAPPVLCEEPVLWNLLVIPEGRAGSRSAGIAQRDWLVEAKPHLTGFDAQAIRTALRERAGLTPTDRDAREWTDEGERLVRTQAAIEAFLSDVSSLGGREADLRARSVELKRLEEAAARERMAADFEPWRRAARAQDELVRVRAELAGLELGSELDVRAWHGLEVELARQAARRQSARLARARSEAKRRVAEDDLAAAEDAVAEAEDRSRAVADADLARRATAAAQDRGAPGPPLARLGGAAFVLGAGLALAGLATWSWLVVAGAALASGGLALWLASRASEAARRSERTARSTILDEARRLGIDADDPTALLRRVLEIESRALRERVRRDAVRKQASAAEDEVEECAREEAAAEGAFAAIDERMRTLRERTELPNAEALAARVERRARLEAQRDAALATLTSVLPGASDEDRARAIAAERDRDPGRAPTPGALSRLEHDLVDARRAVAQLEHETVGAIERGLQSIGERDLSSARTTLEEVRRATEERESVRAGARLALAVVEEAERDVEAHLDRAFDDPSTGAGPLFARLTAGRWAGLRRAETALEALAADGSSVPAEALSRGTHDQLHFALRAALARRILGEPGFFVWDDTFLTADPPRRRALVALAVDLVVEGWQVVYLTVDPAIADLFADEAARRAGIDCRIVHLA